MKKYIVELTSEERSGLGRIKVSDMLPSLCHNNLLSDATIPQQHYLIYWSENPGVLYGFFLTARWRLWYNK